MTHTLHRSGDANSLKEDYVLLALTVPNVNREGSEEKMRQIMEVASRYEKEIVNFAVPFPSKGRQPKTIKEAGQVVSTNYIEHVVFKSRDSLKKCLKELKHRNLGISIVISGIYEDTLQICREIGISPHTVALSLGIHGKTDRLPDKDVLEITTMCGHHLVAPNLVEETVDVITKGKMTHKEGAEELSKQCLCGVFNPYRAEKLLNKMTAEKNE